MSYWTIEEVADALGMTVAQVYETRRRKEYPGNLGRLRGRRLLFPVDLVQAGPQVPESTTDVSEAILWTLQGIEDKLADIRKALTSPLHIRLSKAMADAFMLVDNTFTTTTGDEEE